MGLRLPRSFSPPPQLRSGEHCHDAGQIWIACPACGSKSLLADNKHTVAPDGKVTPAWKCTVPGCSFHEWLELEVV